MQHDRAHIVLGVEEEDAARDVVVHGAVRQAVQPIVDADRRAGLRLVLRVDRGRAVVADEHGVEARGAPGGLDARDEVLADARAQLLAVDDLRAHRRPPLDRASNAGSASFASASS